MSRGFCFTGFYVNPLTPLKMVRLNFYDTENEDTKLCAFANNDNEIYIEIESTGLQYICLDRETAIKLVKTLKTEIAKLDHDEEN